MLQLPLIYSPQAEVLVPPTGYLCFRYQYQNTVLSYLTFNLLKPSGFSTYHQVQHSKILHGARFALSVFYGSQNSQQLLLCT